MREHRWETSTPVSFSHILRTAQRLSDFGLNAVTPEREVIAYIEEWEVTEPKEIASLEPWPLEDVTLIHVLEQWSGDFFLLAGTYHTVVQRYHAVDTYCSLSHPWNLNLETPPISLLPEGLLWLGFRHTHAFVRTRLHTTGIVAPRETHADHLRSLWLEERREAFASAITTLNLPIEITTKDGHISLHSPRHDALLLCSWPDAFGPCQFELNSSDPFEFLVPASRLAATHTAAHADVRAYLTGFPPQALAEFHDLPRDKRLRYRCSVHCVVREIPNILHALGERGRVYSTLAEFQTSTLWHDADDAAAIIGVVAGQGTYRLEVRLNRCPFSQEETERRLGDILEQTLEYAPLPAFP